MKEHRALDHLLKTVINTKNEKAKPLVDAQEIREIARKAVLAEVDTEIQRLTQTENTQQEILSILKEIREHVVKSSEENQKTVALKLDVLQRLKAKLETT